MLRVSAAARGSATACESALPAVLVARCRRLAPTSTIVCAALVAACGGNGSGGTSVAGMSAAPTAYGSTVSWSVNGLGFDRGLAFSVTGGRCDGVAEAPGGSATQRTFTCRAKSIGELVGEVGDADGRRLARLRISIPLPVVRLALTQGTVDVELDPVAATITVNNFLDYVRAGFYDSTLMHRVIANFLIQGGGYTPGAPDPVSKPATAPPIALETGRGLSNLRGTIGMARGSDPNSATSQFYFNVADNTDLDYQGDERPGYAVFGHVVTGLDVVTAISVVPTQSVLSLGLADVPVTDVVVTTARQIR